MSDLEKKILRYWQTEQKRYDRKPTDKWQSLDSEKWQNYLQRQLLKANRPINTILVIEEEPFYLGVMLTQLGYAITEVTSSASKRQLAEDITWQAAADITQLPYKDETFDAVITRNILCHLVHPEEAYQEWLRVLTKGGMLINFGINWYRALYDRRLGLRYEEKQPNVLPLDLAIDSLSSEPLASTHNPFNRPLWDQATLMRFDVQSIQIDEDVTRKLLGQTGQDQYELTPLLAIITIK